MTSSDSLCPKTALAKLVKMACPQDRAEVVAKLEDGNSSFNALEITIKIVDSATFEVDDKELILRRIRRALMASTLTSSNEVKTSSNEVKIEFENQEISLINPLIINFTNNTSNSNSFLESNHKLYFKATNCSVERVSSNQLMIINKRIDVLMEEYKALRSEIVQHLQALHTIMNFSLTALVIGFTAIYSLYPRQGGNASPEMCALFSLLLLIVVPFTGSVMNSLWLVEAGDIGRIGYFLSRTEVEMNSYFDRFSIFKEYELDIDYETSLRRIRNKYDVSGVSSQGFQSFMIIAFFMIIEVLSMLVACWIMFNTPNFSRVIIVIGLSIWVCIYTFLVRYRFKKIQTNEKWYKALNLSRDEVLFLKAREPMNFGRLSPMNFRPCRRSGNMP